MKRHISRSLASLAASGAFALLTLLGGCSENTSGPLPVDNLPPSSTATVEISDPVTADEASSVRSNVQKNSSDTIIVSVEQATDSAKAQYPGSEVVGVKLDYDRDSLNYEVVVRQGDRYYVVVIDPQDGRVISKSEVDNAHYDRQIVVRTIVITVRQARDKVKQFVQGDVVECNLENIDDRPTYVVIILNRENRYITIYIDAETGRERKIKDDDKCKKEDDGSDDDDDDGGSDKHKNKKGRGHYRHGKGHGYGHRFHCHCECVNDDGSVRDSTVIGRMISVDSASVIARTVIDSGRVTKVERRITNDTTAQYELTVERDTNRYVVELDAFDGSLLEVRQIGGDFLNSDFTPRVKNDTLVSLDSARTVALAQRAGVITGWKFEYDRSESKWVYSFDIKIVATNETKKVLVDAKTGAFIRIK